MADDFDDGKGRKDMADFAQFENAINEVKSQIHSTNPAELARLNASIASLLSSNLPSEILSKLKDLQAVVNEREERAEQVVRYTQEEQSREEARLLQEHIEFLEKEAKIANEVREQELEEHVKNYKGFQDDFQKQLKANSDLLEQAAKNPDSLTTEQKAQLTGQYATDKERETAKKKQQEMSKRWKEHYAIKNKGKESITYRQDKIKENEAVINHPNTPEPVREQRRQENAIHKQEVAKQEQNLAVIRPEGQRRETQRVQLLALVNSGNHELAAEMLQYHYLDHIEEYDKEKKQYPNHQGYNELQSMVMALGGHEKLGLPKPEHPIVEQQIPSPQNTKASEIEHQAESIEKPAIQNLQERVESIKKGLEKQQLSNNKSQSSQVNSPANKNQVQDETNPPKPKSRFAQNAKRMEGRG